METLRRAFWAWVVGVVFLKKKWEKGWNERKYGEDVDCKI